MFVVTLVFVPVLRSGRNIVTPPYVANTSAIERENTAYMGTGLHTTELIMAISLETTLFRTVRTSFIVDLLGDVFIFYAVRKARVIHRQTVGEKRNCGVPLASVVSKNQATDLMSPQR